jgi:hypothetical protein
LIPDEFYNYFLNPFPLSILKLSDYDKIFQVYGFISQNIQEKSLPYVFFNVWEPV